MRYCWSYTNNGKDDSISRNLSLIILILVFMMISPNQLHPIKISLFLMFFPIILSMVYVGSRKYCVCNDGLLLAYPLGRIIRVPWEEIGEVTLCKVHYAAKSNAHALAIRCSIGVEKNGPLQAHTARENWQSMMYEVRNHKKIVSIYYTEERYLEFRKHCPCEIRDFRFLKER